MVERRSITTQDSLSHHLREKRRPTLLNCHLAGRFRGNNEQSQCHPQQIMENSGEKLSLEQSLSHRRHKDSLRLCSPMPSCQRRRNRSYPMQCTILASRELVQTSLLIVPLHQQLLLTNRERELLPLLAVVLNRRQLQLPEPRKLLVPQPLNNSPATAHGRRRQ
jgi:hypothetical protein